MIFLPSSRERARAALRESLTSKRQRNISTHYITSRIGSEHLIERTGVTLTFGIGIRANLRCYLAGLRVIFEVPAVFVAFLLAVYARGERSFISVGRKFFGFWFAEAGDVTLLGARFAAGGRWPADRSCGRCGRCCYCGWFGGDLVGCVSVKAVA